MIEIAYDSDPWCFFIIQCLFNIGSGWCGFIKQKCQNHLLAGIYLRIIHVYLAYHIDTLESTQIVSFVDFIKVFTLLKIPFFPTFA